MRSGPSSFQRNSRTTARQNTTPSSPTSTQCSHNDWLRGPSPVGRGESESAPRRPFAVRGATPQRLALANSPTEAAGVPTSDRAPTTRCAGGGVRVLDSPPPVWSTPPAAPTVCAPQPPSLDVAQSAALTARAAFGRTHLGRGEHDRKVSGLSAPFDHKPHSPMTFSFGTAGSAVTPPTAIRASAGQPHKPLAERSHRPAFGAVPRDDVMEWRPAAERGGTRFLWSLLPVYG
jgi:hypothetical protein